jgi:hypothetical protein
MKKELSHGKKIGMAAFIIFEIISILSIVIFGYYLYGSIYYLRQLTDFSQVVAVISTILTTQTLVVGITWGAKASSNFVNKTGEKIE